MHVFFCCDDKQVLKGTVPPCGAAGTAEMSRHLAAALRPESGRAGSAAGGTADGADVAMAGAEEL